MTLAMTAVFWLSAAALVYTWFGYLAMLALVARFTRRTTIRSTIRPSVTFIIPVYNGGSMLSLKLDNLAELDYPAELVEIIVVDDCSDDLTAVGVRAGLDLHVIRLEQRSGKAAALNAGLEVATGDVVAFTDVGAMLRPDALVRAVERFADPGIGCVSSEDEVVSAGGVGASEGLYTRMDTLIRRFESSILSATGMSGSFYLVQRELCPPFPLDLATDMFSALHCVGEGYRAVVEEHSKVELEAQRAAGREFERKVRTMVTGLRAMSRFRPLLNPARSGVFALFLVSHKVLRYLMPLFVVFAVVSTAWLSARDTAWAVILAVAAVIVCIGIGGIVYQSYTSCTGRFGSATAFVCMSVAAAAVGWFKYLAGEKYEIWRPTERSRV